MVSRLKTESSTSLLLNMEISNDIFLPNFQRQFSWDVDTQKQLIMSLLAGVPIGQLMFFKASTNSFRRRALCHSLIPNIKEDRETFFLLDGQQRLSTLKNIICDIYGADEVNRFSAASSSKDLQNEVDPKLKSRWFICFPDATNFLGLKTLEFATPSDALPSEFENYVESKPLNDWFFETDTELLSQCMKEKVVPLWTLMSTGIQKSKEKKSRSENVTRKALGQIAQNRLEYIRKGKPTFPTSKAEKWADDFFDYLNEALLDAEVLVNHKIDSNNPNKMIATFEQANKEGMQLTVYDLVVAKHAHADHKNSLTEILGRLLAKERTFTPNLCKGTTSVSNWTPVKVQGFWSSKGKEPEKTFKNIFLNCLALELFDKTETNVWTHLAVSHTKAEKILERVYEAKEIEKAIDRTLENFLRAFEYLVARLGIYQLSQLTYERMFLPIYTTLRGYKSLEKPILDKLEYWYWLSIFSGRYQANQNEISTQDIRALSQWIGRKKQRRANNPFAKHEKDVFSVPHYSTFGAVSLTGLSKEKKKFRADTQAPNTSLKDAVLQFVLSRKPIDFSTEGNKPILAVDVMLKEKRVNIHHLLFCGEDRGKTTHPINSVINKTHLTAKVNSEISNKIEKYQELLKEWEENNCLHNFESHCIDSNFLSRAQNFVSNTIARNEEEVEKVRNDFLFERFEKLSTTVKTLLNSLK